MVLELRVFLLPGSTIFGSLRNLLFLLLYVNWETETRRYYEIVYPLPSEHKSATTMWKEDECQWFSSNDQECVSPRFSPSYEATRYGERNREGLLSKRCISPGNASSRMNTLFDVAWTRKSSHNNVEKLLLKRLISGKTRWRNVFFDVTSSRGKRNKLCAWKRSKRRLLCTSRLLNVAPHVERDWEQACIYIYPVTGFRKAVCRYSVIRKKWNGETWHLHILS